MRYREMKEKFRLKRAFARMAVGAAVAASIGLSVASAVEPEREAHDTYCIACHDTSVYTRSDRLARNYDELRAQVVRWHSNISLNWSDEEIDRMTAWLAKHYYHFQCPMQC
jgi:cytochrome c553